MPLRRISSLFTFPAKYLWTPLSLIGILYVILQREWYLDLVNPTQEGLIFFVIIFVFEAFGIWHVWAIKWVAIDQANRRLYVSNYRREIAIPYSEIASVSESKWTDPRRVTVCLHHPSEFGEKIVFLAKYRYDPFFGDHPIVAELNHLAASAAPKGWPS
jgi:hypothetical protein